MSCDESARSYVEVPVSWRLRGTASELIRSGGHVPANQPDWNAACLMLLRDHLMTTTIDRGLLARVRDAWLVRVRPAMPESQRYSLDGLSLRTPRAELCWVNPWHIFPSHPGTASFIHDNSDAAQNFDGTGDGAELPAAVAGLVDFAARIIHERADPRGLQTLLGRGGDGPLAIDLEGWLTDGGSYFRVKDNGNHRSAAFAIAQAPCVLATVHWQEAPFHSIRAFSWEKEPAIARHRALLHTLGIAAFVDPQSEHPIGDCVWTQWPPLIESPDSCAASLNALRDLGLDVPPTLGGIPTSVFADENALRSAAGACWRGLRQVEQDLEAAASGQQQQAGPVRRLLRRLGG